MTSSICRPKFRSAWAAGIGMALAMCSGELPAQSWPTRPITLVVPFPPGGATDIAARIVAAKMSAGLGQSILVQNRGGASGTIGADQVAKAAPDGYTLLMLATPTLLAGHKYGPLNYDLFKDFIPVGTADELPLVMVVNSKVLPDVHTLPQLIAKAKAEHGKLKFTSPGEASFGHLGAEVLKSRGGFDMVHVPYLGAAPAVTDLLAGQVAMMFCDLVVVQPYIASGALRAIAVGSTRPVNALPGVKTVADQGFAGFEATAWAGILAPARTPKKVIARLTAELKIASADPAVQKALGALGGYSVYRTPSQTSARMHRDFDRWGSVMAKTHAGRVRNSNAPWPGD